MTDRRAGTRRRLNARRIHLRLPGRDAWSARLGGIDLSSWRPALVPVILVLIVLVASLAAQGHDHRKAPLQGDEATALSRTLSCVRDVPGSSSRVGTVPQRSSGYSVEGPRATFPPEAASDGYGTQWSSGKRGNTSWLAARACPALSGDWWFVGAGSSQQHHSVLTLDNPQSVDATFALTIYGPNGRITVPGGNALLVPAGTTRRWHLNRIAATAGGDLTVRVKVTRGLLAASMWDTWSLTPGYAPVHQWIPSSRGPAKRVQLLGMPGRFTPGSSLLITNHDVDVSAVVKVRAINGSATFTPTKHAVVNVPPASTIAVPVGGLRKTAIDSLVLTSTHRITAGLRQARDGAEAYAVPARRLGAKSVVGLPAGVAARLVLTAARTTPVQVTALNAKGATLMSKSVAVPAGKTLKITMPPKAVALSVTSESDSTVTAAVALTRKGIAVLRMVPTANEAKVPVVVPQNYSR